MAKHVVNESPVRLNENDCNCFYLSVLKYAGKLQIMLSRFQEDICVLMTTFNLDVAE